MTKVSAWEEDMITKTAVKSTSPERPTCNDWFSETFSWVSKCISKKALLWVLTWSFCITFSFFFIRSTFMEFLQSDPITTVTFIDYPVKPDPIVVKVCNSIFLDAKKILNYNGTNFSYDSYEFLLEAVSGNYQFDDSKWVLLTSVNDIFFLSSRILDAFRLDVDDFLATCYVVGTYKDCIPDFRWYLDRETSCYQAEIDLGGYGRNRALKMGFYFNPDIQFRKYIEQQGVYVTFSTPNNYIPYSRGFFLEPKEYVIVSATREHKIQERSFDKAKCTNIYGPQWYNFTGKPFQVDYNREFCSNLCFAEAYYKQCNCSPFYGMNQTNSECLEIEEVRMCLKKLGAFPATVETASQSCLSGCLSKCTRTYLTQQVFKERNKNTKHSVKAALEDYLTYGYISKITSMLLARLTSSVDPLAEADVIKEHIAHVTFYLETNQQDVVVQVSPFMTFSTLVSNVGGLMGLWLGLSAISIIQFLENFVTNVMVLRYTCGRRKRKQQPAAINKEEN